MQTGRCNNPYALVNPKHSADPALCVTRTSYVLTPPYRCANLLCPQEDKTRHNMHCSVTRHSGCRQCVIDSVCHPGPRVSFCRPGGGAGHRHYAALRDVTILHYTWWHTTYLVMQNYGGSQTSHYITSDATSCFRILHYKIVVCTPYILYCKS